MKIHGQEVTPNMNRLRRRAMHWVVQAPKGMGSSDADFKALMARPPSADLPTYKIPEYPYRGALPERLSSLGYQTLALHGVTGEFFNRRSAYGKMGFSDLIFREEFISRKLAPVHGWTVSDADLLRYAAVRVEKASGKFFEMIITATSHIPFPLPREDKVFFPDADDAEWAYFDSQHYVDAAIGRFVDALPAETTLVLYGDHTSQVENAKLDYQHVTRDGAGCVPFFVVDTTLNLAPQQRTGELAESCEVTLLEGLRWFSHTVLATAPRGSAAHR
jgi:phosphoglycerol transferase MdoB-like AlkP superfamily enzyme